MTISRASDSADDVAQLRKYDAITVRNLSHFSWRHPSEVAASPAHHLESPVSDLSPDGSFDTLYGMGGRAHDGFLQLLISCP